jgi:basic membrane protein A
MVPESVRKKVLAKKEAIKSGQFKVFSGPIQDQQGKLRVADGASMPDKDLLGMTWFVKGVIGTTQ